MYPVLFRWGDAALFTYPVIFGIAFFVALFVWIKETRPYGVPVDKIINLCLGAFFSGLLGARALHVFVEWRAFWEGSKSWSAPWEGGVVFLGGFVAAAAFLFWRLPKSGLARRIGFDTAAPAIAWAHAVGRLACFANGCCHGKICDLPWAVTYRDPLSAARPLGVPLHPSQLYESAGLVILAVMLQHNNRKLAAARRFSSSAIYLGGYGLLRFAIEFTRGDPERGAWGGLSTSQWISLTLILGAVLLDSVARKDHNALHESRN